WSRDLAISATAFGGRLRLLERRNERARKRDWKSQPVHQPPHQRLSEWSGGSAAEHPPTGPTPRTAETEATQSWNPEAAKSDGLPQHTTPPARAGVGRPTVANGRSTRRTSHPLRRFDTQELEARRQSTRSQRAQRQARRALGGLGLEYGTLVEKGRETRGKTVQIATEPVRFE